MDFVFKRETVKKKDFYSRLKQILLDSGWQNISSRPSSDFDIFYSEGEEGNMGLYFQMKDFDTNANAGFANSTRGELYIKTLKGYTPSTTVGGAGTFERNDAWRTVRVTTNLHLESDLTFYYHCNKNRLILYMYFPASYPSNASSSFFTVGMQARVFGKKLPKHELLLACTDFSTNANYSAYIVDQVDMPKNTSYPIRIYDAFDTYETQARGITLNGTLLFSEVSYGSTDEGVRGILDGVYTLKDIYSAWWSSNFWLDNLKSGDQFINDGKKYMIIRVASNVQYSSFKTPYLAFRIE